VPEGEIHRVDPDFGSTLTASNRDSQSNCWVNLKIVGQPCEFQVRARLRAAERTIAAQARPPSPPPPARFINISGVRPEKNKVS
jgi:hypothetical protein